MDCPSEEQMIRMKLADVADIKSLTFDLPGRQLKVIHTNDYQEILEKLETLQYGTSILSSEAIVYHETEEQHIHAERNTLWAVLIINFTFFAIEFTAGLIAYSMSLVADSLDMMADAIVYGLALFATGGTVIRKKNIARLAGYLQIVLAMLGFSEVIRRFIGGDKIPDFMTMIVVSVFALVANVISLYLLQKRKSKEAHIQASMIFTSNDIIINTGVIVGGFFVFWFGSNYPDLVIGAVVFLIVARGAYRILQLSK